MFRQTLQPSLTASSSTWSKVYKPPSLFSTACGPSSLAHRRQYEMLYLLLLSAVRNCWRLAHLLAFGHERLRPETYAEALALAVHALTLNVTCRQAGT
jgi:hypothetical protein